MRCLQAFGQGNGVSGRNTGIERLSRPRGIVTCEVSTQPRCDVDETMIYSQVGPSKRPAATTGVSGGKTASSVKPTPGPAYRGVSTLVYRGETGLTVMALVAVAGKTGLTVMTLVSVAGKTGRTVITLAAVAGSLGPIIVLTMAATTLPPTNRIARMVPAVSTMERAEEGWLVWRRAAGNSGGWPN